MKKYLLAMTMGLFVCNCFAATESFDNNADKLGKWTATTPDKASIIKHPGQDNKVYHLHGKNAQTVLELSKPTDIYQVKFNLERWTGAGDFNLKIEGFDGKKWINFTTNIDKKIGTKKIHSIFALSNTNITATNRNLFTKIRFTANTVENKGALIDDIEILEVKIMEFIEAQEPVIKVSPILRDRTIDSNPPITIPVKVDGAIPNLKITEISFSIDKGNNDFEKLQIIANNKVIKELKNPIVIDNNQTPQSLCFKSLDITLPTGIEAINIIPVAKKNAIIGDKITTTISSITIEDMTTKKTTEIKPKISITQTISDEIVYDNYMMGDKKVRGFRIPGLTTTKQGTLIAVYDIRYNHHGDLPANIDVGISRSTDGGQTWGPISIAMHKEIEGLGHGVGDPAILTDEKTGRIWIAALGAPKSGHPIWSSVANSADPKDCGQFILTYSDDDGLTWSKPINITEKIKRLNDSDTKNWGCLFQGPGNGFTMRDGTLVFPSQVWTKKDDGKTGSSLGVLVYSKDGGKTWESSKATTFDNIHASESQALELTDGSIMFNARNEHRNGFRFVATTKDIGATWAKHPTDRNKETGLREPTCQASIMRVSYKPNIIAFCNPDTHRGRHTMTIKLSFDDGMSWTKGKVINEMLCYGYSAMTMVDKDTIGVIYETRGGLIFEKFKVQEIIDAK